MGSACHVRRTRRCDPLAVFVLVGSVAGVGLFMDMDRKLQKQTMADL